MHKYIFILGQGNDLAKQEINSVMDETQDKNLKSGQNFIVASSGKSAEQLMPVLGGTIKIAEFIETIDDLSKLSTEKWLIYLKQSIARANGEKIHFGFSLYNASNKNYQTVQKTALTVKKQIKEEHKVRLVSSKEPALSSVIVAKNKLINNELLIVKYNNQWLLGMTRAVQDFVKYGRRDMERPGRDSKSGMLPPKVSQMMLNIGSTSRQKVILDPFCGSGTILQEAMLLGFKGIHGSDLSPKAVQDSKNNVKWLKKEFDLDTEANIQQSDIQNLNKNFAPNSIDLIVTEPFMGDARIIRNKRNIQDLIDIKEELQYLYLKAFTQFKQILKPKGKIVFIFPIFNIRDENLSTLDKNLIKQIDFSMVPPKIKSDQLSDNGNIIYSRPGQVVQREISVWQ
jgi:tRNA G10  N-methylase Trm11